MNKLDALLERLESMYDHRGDSIPTQHVNPDGPEAAKVIREMREALVPLAAVADLTDSRKPRASVLINVDLLRRARNALGREG